jgi:hypothetical protein
MASAEVKPAYRFPALGFMEIKGAGDADLIALFIAWATGDPVFAVHCRLSDNSRYATIDNNVSNLAYFYNFNSL